MLPQTRPIEALAPMDGITDRAYRQIVRKLNPDVWLYSEFTSINGIEHSEHVRKRLEFESLELPFFVQLFGNDPELFAKIVEEISYTGISGVDINFGCPSKRIVNQGNGACMTKDPDLAFQIVEAAVKATTLPVTVKTRLGWSDSENVVSFCKGLESAGAQLITLHGRTAKQMYRGEASWDEIYEVKNAVGIPVLGNGDIKGQDQALGQLKNLDGYMIGRASIGNPWVFWSDEKRAAIPFKDKIDVMLEHYQAIRSYKEEQRALVEFRKHLSGYVTDMPGARAMRALLMSSEDEKEFIKNALSLV